MRKHGGDPGIVGRYFGEDNISLSGMASRVKNKDEFVLSFSGGTVRVDTSDSRIPDNDRIAVGDRVAVYGEIEKGLFNNRKPEAEAIEKIGTYSRASADTPPRS